MSIAASSIEARTVCINPDLIKSASVKWEGVYYMMSYDSSAMSNYYMCTACDRKFFVASIQDLPCIMQATNDLFAKACKGSHCDRGYTYRLIFVFGNTEHNDDSPVTHFPIEEIEHVRTVVKSSFAHNARTFRCYNLPTHITYD